jgi:hypothetical protein
MKSCSKHFGWLALWLIAASASAADLTGRVVLVGAPPLETRIDLTRYPVLAQKHPDGLMTRRYQTDVTGGLQGVLVYLKGDLQLTDAKPPETPLVLDHQDGWFAPHVMGLQVGQELQLLYPKGAVIQADCKDQPGFMLAFNNARSFSKPEVGIRMKCHCHPFNFGYVGVFDHPFFAVTDAKGNYRISGVPPGRYTVEAWHPKAGTSSSEVALDGSACCDLYLVVKTN